MKYLVAFLFSALTLSVVAQELFKPNHSFKVELGLPSSQGNLPFKRIMQGLFNVSPYYQYTLPFGLNFGAGGNFNYFTINEFRLPGIVKGGVATAGGFGKLGFEKFFTPILAVDFGVKFGYSYSWSKTTKTIEKIGRAHTYDAPYVEPMLNIYLMADESSAFSLSVGYVFRGVKFNETHLMVDELTGYDEKEFNKNSHYLLVGFGYSYYFGRKSQQQ
jgi:hypothetical protein